MTRIGNLSYYIKNNKICAAEYSTANEITEFCCFTIENIVVEADNGIVKFHLHNDNVYREHHLHAYSIEDAKKLVSAIYHDIKEL